MLPGSEFLVWMSALPGLVLKMDDCDPFLNVRGNILCLILVHVTVVLFHFSHCINIILCGSDWKQEILDASECCHYGLIVTMCFQGA